MQLNSGVECLVSAAFLPSRYFAEMSQMGRFPKWHPGRSEWQGMSAMVSGRRICAPGECLRVVSEQAPNCGSRRLFLSIRLFGDFERVIHFDPQIAERAFQLPMAQQQLNGAQVPGFPVDQ